MAGVLPSRPSSPFVGYTRTLTSEGGVLISYKDRECRLRYTILRIFTWTVANGLGAWEIFHRSDLSTLFDAIALRSVSRLSTPNMGLRRWKRRSSGLLHLK
jgi:hypothetical protein